MYDATRPDLCHAVSFFSIFQSYPTEEHWIHLKCVLRYVKGSIKLKLCYKKNINTTQVLFAYIDADVNNCRFTARYLIKFYDSKIWCSKKQQTVAISSIESEYMTVSVAICEILWMKSLL